MEFNVYPCNRNGKILPGFCLTICDGNGLLQTIASWKRFSSKFGIKYYAFKDSLMSDYSIVKL